MRHMNTKSGSGRQPSCQMTTRRHQVSSMYFSTRKLRHQHASNNIDLIHGRGEKRLRSPMLTTFLRLFNIQELSVSAELKEDVAEGDVADAKVNQVPSSVQHLRS